jgi:hypothetical protein
MEESIMSDKRFNRVGGYVYDGEKCISHFEDVKHRDDIVKLLNELHEENKELKKDIKQIHTYIDNAILTERTRMGKNCLKQLKEGLQ